MRKLPQGIAALSILLMVGLAPLVAAGTASAQGANPSIDQINRRQIRQDRILGWGFGINALLLIALIVLVQRRLKPPAGGAAAAPASVAAQSAASTVADRVARLRLRTKLSLIARRQKRIERLLNEMRETTVDDLSTRGRLRESLDKLLEEADRIRKETEDSQRNGASPAGRA